MSYNELYNIPIQEIAKQLGIEVTSKKNACCFNKSNHKHGDTHPSLIFGKKNTWYCAVCNFDFNGKRYGNNIDLVKEYYGIDFKEALVWFEKHFYINPSNKIREGTANIESDNKQVSPRDIEIYNDFIKLCGGVEGPYLRYLKNRGLSKFILKEYRISNVKSDAIQKIKRIYSVEDLINSGLFRLSTKTKELYFIFTHFPIVLPFLYSNDIVYLQFRSLNPKSGGRYKNLSKEVLFPYNVNILTHPDISGENVLIAEGVLDTLTLLDKGINAIGIIGNNFKPQWVELFQIFDVNPVIALDEDMRGKRSEQIIANFFNKPISRVYPSDFGEGKDWNEIILTGKRCEN
jgi:DNA primase